MSLIENYRKAGFSDQEIRPHINQIRVKYSEAGFSNTEINDNIGTFNDPAVEEFSTLAPETEVPKAEESIFEPEKLSIREQLKVEKAVGSLPSPIGEEVRKRAIELQREKEFGTISETPFSVGLMISYIPKNTSEIVNSVSSLIASTGIFTYRFGKNLIADANTVISGKLRAGEAEGEVEKQFKPATDFVGATITDMTLLLSGEDPKELAKLPAGKAYQMCKEVLERQGLFTTLKNFVQYHPVDAFFVGTALYQAVGRGAALSIEGVNTFIPKGTKVSEALDTVLSTKRSPILYEMPVIKDDVEVVAKSVEFARDYSKNPLTKYIFQKSFDAVLEEYPGMSQMFGTHKAKKLLNGLRNVYEDATFEERRMMHDDIFKQLNTLTAEEQTIMVPYLEGRLSLISEPSEQFKGFETWYRTLIGGVQGDLMERGALTAKVIENRMYQPIVKATGLSKEEIMAEFGDFSPVYVHHFFPDKYAQKMGVHFADTTGKRFKPGFLKRSKGVSGYSENLKEVLPKWISEYTKFKNTEAFINDFTGKFGVKVNIKDVEEVIGGLKVGDKVYEGYKIIAPDNYLSFYRRKVDFYKEVSKRMDNATFDEAIGDALKDMSLSVVGVSKNKPVYLVPEALTTELESFATPIFGSAKVQDVVRLLVDKPTQIWKDSVLALTPRWMKNNVMGDIIFNTMEGVGPMSYSRGFQKMYHDVIPDELIKASFANVMKYNPKLGKTAETAIGGLVQELYASKTVEGISKGKDALYAVNTMFEQPFVRALYVKLAREKAVKLLKSGKAPVTEESILAKMAEMKNTPELVAPIIKKVKETLPVFNLTGNWERKYIRRLVPFYNWYKFMGKYAATLPVKHPFKTVGARGLGALSEKQREEVYEEMFPFMAREIEDSGIPEVFSHLWPTTNENGKVTFFNARGLNAFATIEDFMQLDFINMTTPVFTVPYERIVGRSAFGDREFKSGEKGVEYTVDGVQYNDFEKVRPPLMDHILRQFPQYDLLKKSLVPARQYDTGTVLNPEPIMDEVTGEPQYPINAIEKMLNYMGIDRKTMDDIELRKRWDNYQQRKRQALGAAFRKGQGKSSQALSFDEIREIINSIKDDEKLWNKLRGEVRDLAQARADETRRLRDKIEMEERIR